VVEALVDLGADVNIGEPIGRALAQGSLQTADLLYDHGARFRDLSASLMGPCEAQQDRSIWWLLNKGADPDYYDAEWNCSAMMAVVQPYTRSERIHDCIAAFIEAGATWEDGPVMDILRGLPDRLKTRIGLQSELLDARFDLDFGDHLTLRGSSLLHIAVEYNVPSCVDVLLDGGADLNAPSKIGPNGLGGQSPLFHAIGSNQGSCYQLFEYLMNRKPDLEVRALVQENPSADGKVMDCMHKGREHFFETVRSVTPLAYAIWYEHGPEWRSTAREAARLRDAGLQ